MRKLFLLTIALIATLASAFAGSDANGNYYIIKDGRVCEDITIMPYPAKPWNKPNLFQDTTINGEDVICYVQKSTSYLDVKLKLDSINPLDLSKSYVMVLEYYIPQENVSELKPIVEYNKPMFIIGMEEEYNTIETTPNPTACATSIYMDVKFGPIEEWVTAKRYVYSNLQKVQGMVFSYAREMKEDILVYPRIKNFYFEPFENGVKPFFAENFDEYSLGDFYNENNRVDLEKASFYCGITPVVTENDIKKAEEALTKPFIAFRDFIPERFEGTDGSGYYDTDLLHAMQVEPERDSIVFPNIAIPSGADKIFSQMLVKMHKNEGRWVIASADSAEALTLDMPIKVKFNTGEIVDLSNDVLPSTWTKYYGEVDVPAGATSFDLIFSSMKVGYTVDEIMLSAENLNGVKDIKANSFSVNAYVDNNGNIVVLNGEMIAAYNLNGQKASKEDKAIIIIVKNDEGAIASKLMIRK